MPSVRPDRRQLLFAAAAGMTLWPCRSRGDTLPATAPATAPTTQPALPAGITERCDTLLERAIRSPYGFGWHEENPGVDLIRSRPRGRPPEIDSTLTARVGLLLFLVGERTGVEKYASAAIEAARGLVAVQAKTGQFRAQGVMGAFGGTKDDATDVPDRRPTCAALACLLTLLASQPKQDVRLRGPAQRAAHWLVGQQSRAGGWPNAFPPNAGKGEASKLFVLNQTDHRDTALVTILAGDLLSGDDGRGVVTPDRQLHLSFTRAAEMLTYCRVLAGLPPTRALWPTICKLDGDSNTRLQSVPVCVDLLSSRYALEVLLAGYLVQQAGAFGETLRAARDALSTLPRDPQKQWHRRYDLRLQPILSPPADTGGVFRDPVPSGPPEAPPHTAELFATIEQVVERGAKRSHDLWQQSMSMSRRLALTVSGFRPEAMLHADPPTEFQEPRVGGIESVVWSAWKEWK